MVAILLSFLLGTGGQISVNTNILSGFDLQVPDSYKFDGLNQLYTVSVLTPI